MLDHLVFRAGKARRAQLDHWTIMVPLLVVVPHRYAKMPWVAHVEGYVDDWLILNRKVKRHCRRKVDVQVCVVGQVSHELHVIGPRRSSSCRVRCRRTTVGRRLTRDTCGELAHIELRSHTEMDAIPLVGCEQ